MLAGAELYVILGVVAVMAVVVVGALGWRRRSRARALRTLEEEETGRPLTQTA